MKNIKFLLIPALFATLVSCVNGDDYGTPDLSSECVTLSPTKEVNEITSNATVIATEYTQNDVIEAYITSSDEGGNFYKTISMVSINGNVGFSMPIDSYNLYTKFEPGRKVYVNLINRFINVQHSSTVIGSLYNNNTPDNPNDDTVGRISGVEYQDVILRSCEKVDEETLVNDFSSIAQALDNQHLHKIIEFDNVQFTDVSIGYNYFDKRLNANPTWTATNHKITDADGNNITVRVSEFANFASQPIPSGNGKIRGVLTKFNSEFQLMIRTINDVKLTNPRLNPILEDFESYTSGTNVFSNYFNLSVQGTNDWFVGSFSGNKYLQARKGSSTGATRIFFVMPYDFDAFTKVSFRSLYGYMSLTSTPIMKVYYSTNFNSANPTANLVEITGSFMFSNHTGTGWASGFTNSGVHTFTGMSGQGHIIFAYDVSATSTTNAESRPGAQIDNILFQ